MPSYISGIRLHGFKSVADRALRVTLPKGVLAVAGANGRCGTWRSGSGFEQVEQDLTLRNSRLIMGAGCCSGKSNLVDAIAFCSGCPVRSLRVTRLADVQNR